MGKPNEVPAVPPGFHLKIRLRDAKGNPISNVDYQIWSGDLPIAEGKLDANGGLDHHLAEAFLAQAVLYIGEKDEKAGTFVERWTIPIQVVTAPAPAKAAPANKDGNAAGGNAGQPASPPPGGAQASNQPDVSGSQPAGGPPQDIDASDTPYPPPTDTSWRLAMDRPPPDFPYAKVAKLHSLAWRLQNLGYLPCDTRRWRAFLSLVESDLHFLQRHGEQSRALRRALERYAWRDGCTRKDVLVADMDIVGESSNNVLDIPDVEIDRIRDAVLKEHDD
jgi:hypothetical protein